MTDDMSTILIIEDEPFLLEMYKKKFLEEGYRVITATNGDPGIELAKKTSPDLILLDIVMPDKDGYEVLKDLKHNTATSQIPILVFSNLGQKEEIEKGLALGADDYVVKTSLTPKELVKKVKEFISKKGGSNDRKTKILLIEDEEVIISMYQLRFKKEGWEVTIARNGAWGLRLANEEPYDIVLLDMVMPAMEGLMALKNLKASEKTKNIPVLVLSNSAQDSDIKAALETGAAAYFVKSKITPAVVVDKIKEIIAQSRNL